MKSFAVTENGLDNEWMARAACRSKTKLFFPSVGGNPSAEVKAVCADCPVFEQCGAYARSLPKPPTGVWAGEMWRVKALSFFATCASYISGAAGNYAGGFSA